VAGTHNVFDFWSRIDTLELAEEASKGGFAASMFCAAVTSLLAIASYFGFTLIPGVGLFSLIDAALFAGFGWGIRRHSRVCAVLALLFYCAEQYNNGRNHTAVNAVLMALLVVLYVRAVRGTFAYHRIKKNEAGMPPLTPDKSQERTREE
jgi:hypothetical protein